jgi:hypothetical protein
VLLVKQARRFLQVTWCVDVEKRVGRAHRPVHRHVRQVVQNAHQATLVLIQNRGPDHRQGGQAPERKNRLQHVIVACDRHLAIGLHSGGCEAAGQVTRQKRGVAGAQQQPVILATAIEAQKRRAQAGQRSPVPLHHIHDQFVSIGRQFRVGVLRADHDRAHLPRQAPDDVFQQGFSVQLRQRLGRQSHATGLAAREDGSDWPALAV